MRPTRLYAVPFLAVLAAAACSHKSDNPSDTTLVVGLTADQMPPVLGAVHVTATVEGGSPVEQTFRVAGDPKVFPREVKLAAGSKADAKVEVHVDAYLDPNYQAGSKDAPVLSRLATTSLVPSKQMLLRLPLDERCLTGGLGGGIVGPTCAAPLTCVGGVCVDSVVPTSALELYTPNWATDAPDICKPAGAGAPQVIVGTGQTDYLPLTDGQTLKAELGPQGGHHIWIAVRMHNIKQSGSTTTITGKQPGSGLAIPPTAFVFTYDRDEGGYCKLYGLRYQLDNGGIDYKPFLGQPLDVTVEIVDLNGVKGSGVAHINIDPAILCPPNTPTCK